MSSFKIKSITINHASSQVKITRSLLFNENDDWSYHYIPDEINQLYDVEIEDSVADGSELLFPFEPQFPSDLERYKDEKFKFQMIEGSHIIGKFIKTLDNKHGKFVVVDVEEFHSFKSQTLIPNGPVSLNQEHIIAYLPMPSDQSTSNDNNLLKVNIKNTSISREIEVTYCIKPGKQPLGHITHSIKGVKSEPFYTNPNLESNIPMTLITEYNWTPIWQINNRNEVIVGDNDCTNNGSGVTFNIITQNEKQTYTIKDFTCHKNRLNKIKINQIETKCNRAALVYPLGPIQIALYFENNSNLLLTKSPISFIGENVRPSTTFVTTKQVSPQNPAIESYQFLKSVQPNSIGVIIFSIPNERIKIFKDIAHQPLYETRYKEYNITEIKLSNIFTLIDAEIKNKMKYQFVNATQYPTKYIVHVGEYASDESSLGIEINKSSNSTSSCEKIGQSLYLFNSLPLSINDFEMSYGNSKQLMTHSKLPQVLINYLNEKGISIKYNPNKFETYNLSNLDRNSQDTILKLMNTLFLEEKTSNYFNKSFSNSLVTCLFGNDNVHSNTSSAFGKSSAPSFGSTQPQQQSGLFGSSQAPQGAPNFSFGSSPAHQTQTPAAGLFGSTQAPRATTGFSFSSSPQQAQPQAPQQQGGLFGSSQAPQVTTNFSFGSTKQQEPPTNK